MFKLFNKKQVLPDLNLKLLVEKRPLWEDMIREVMAQPDLLCSYKNKMDIIMSNCKYNIHDDSPAFVRLFPNRDRSEIVLVENDSRTIKIETIANKIRDTFVLNVFFREGKNTITLEFHRKRNSYLITPKDSLKTVKESISQQLYFNMTLVSVKEDFFPVAVRGQNLPFKPSDPGFPWDMVNMVMGEINKIIELKNSIFLAEIEPLLMEPEKVQLSWTPSVLKKSVYQNLLSEELAGYSDRLIASEKHQLDVVAEEVMEKVSLKLKEKMKAEIKEHEEKIKKLKKEAKELEEVYHPDFGPN